MINQNEILKYLKDEQLKFIDIFKSICLTLKERLALRLKEQDGYREFSYFDLWIGSQNVATYIINIGIKKHECVAILVENRPEWAICFFGIASSACLTVPLESKLKERELAYVLNDCKSRLLFVDKNNLERAVKLKSTCANLKYIVCLDEITEEHSTAVDFSKIKFSASEFKQRTVENDSVALVVYTSGTTGIQKGVQLTFSNLLFQLRAFQKILRPQFSDRFLSVLPLSHTLEISCGLLGPLFSGCAIIYLSSLKSKDLIQEIKNSRITMMIVVPLILRIFHNNIWRNIDKLSLFVRLYFKIIHFICLRLKQVGLSVGKIFFKKVHQGIGSSLRCFICGGAPLDPLVASGFELFGISVLEGYGLTETSPVISVNTFTAKKIGSVGKPLEHVEVKILKEDMMAKEGEIITRGPHLMKGYFNAPEKTAQVIKNGWLHTGDIGYFDKEGFLYISGRLKDIIVTGKGKKVFPEEIETELLRSPFIKEACVYGRIAKEGLRKGTEEVSAIIVPDMDYFISHAKKAKPEDIEWLIKHTINESTKELADYKRITNFKIWYQDLPKTTTKKILRRQIGDILKKLGETT